MDVGNIQVLTESGCSPYSSSKLKLTQNKIELGEQH